MAIMGYRKNGHAMHRRIRQKKQLSKKCVHSK